MWFVSCGGKTEERSSFVGKEAEQTTSAATDYDLSTIQECGELIAVTLQGPDSYYEYRGSSLGREFSLAENFTQREGLRLRMEVAKDTIDLLRILLRGDADLIALELPASFLVKHRLLACGAYTDSVHTTWAVRKSSPELCEALKRWFKPTMKIELSKFEVRALGNHSVRRHVRAPYLSKQKGVISLYDAQFKQHAMALGWDWRLLAAQCYQESGFDPEAISWAGARGLMQIMPATAAHLGLSQHDIHQPSANIAAGTRYIGELLQKFRDVPDRVERIKFVLASYNGGYYHIRDAMSLARKHGQNPYAWSGVGPYVLKLSERAYYTDAVVKNGYMVGKETYGYVNSIMERWTLYRGGAAGSFDNGMHSSPERATKRNRFSRKHEIMGPDDALFSGEPES
ncbi:MAG: transglycosylase SLT domain-containing protein [Bacteroidaceae bacterium]